MTAPRIHPTAIIERSVKIGDDTSVWDNVHVREDTRIGCQCIVGGKTVIAYGVNIGNRVKINSMAYICHGVTIEDGVMISAGVIFTNDQLPRATTPDLQTLLTSEPTEETQTTRVCEGATIGAGCTIGNDLTIGRFAMVGMGSVVTRSVPDFHLAFGQPARSRGCVCRCGTILRHFREDTADQVVDCDRCGRRYSIADQRVTELSSAAVGGGERSA